MTCIVGIRHREGALLAADSLGSDGHVAVVRNDPKLFALRRDGAAAIGITGSFRMGQVVSAHLDLVAHDPMTPAFGWAVGTFVPALRALLAVGSGAECALGALAALIGTRLPADFCDSDEARSLAHKAIAAAEQHTPHVRGPVRFLEVSR